MATQYPVIELFQSFQGEGTHIGKAANFIRLAGCNLRCPWCDTNWSLERGAFMTASEIVEKLEPDRITVITGGEPFMYNLSELIDAILKRNDNYYVCIETNGTFATSYVLLRTRGCVWITCSPKPQNDWKIHTDCQYDELKYVIDDKIQLKNIMQRPLVPVWLQPEATHLKESYAKCLTFQVLRPDLRIGTQLHKTMGVR